MGFRATSGGVTARFTRSEATVIRILVEQVVELVAELPPSDGTLDLAGVAGEPASPANLDAYADANDAPRRASDADDPSRRVPDADELAAMVGLDDRAGLGEARMPDDPVLARLLPDGYRDDPEAAQEFRRFTESGLRSAKLQAARTLLETLPPGGGKVRLSSEHAEAWLRSLNDVRLALGVRLGVTEDDDQPGDDQAFGDPRFGYVLFVYHWLAELQDSLVTALS